MKNIIVKCSLDDLILLEIQKETVTSEDISMLRKSCACNDHGPNAYEYEMLEEELLDEEGNSFNPPQYITVRGNLLSSQEHIIVEVEDED